MRAPRSRPTRPGTSVLLLVLLSSLVVATAVFAAPPGTPVGEGVVFAVDTSRSLRAQELAAIQAKLGEVARGLEAGTPVGLLAFDDDVTWILPMGSAPTDLAAALQKLAPKGGRTVIHDGLVTAARALAPNGGVVVLATDGRDEGSATTPEDVGRICGEAKVRILALSIGRQVDRRALKRIVLLSGGKDLGSLASVSPETISAATREVRSAARSTEAVSPSPEATAGPSGRNPASPPDGVTPVGTEPTSGATPSPGFFSRIPWGLWVLLLVAVVFLVVVLGGRWRRGETQELALNLEPAAESFPDLRETGTDDGGAVKGSLPAGTAGEGTAPHVPAAEELLDPGVFEKTPGVPNIERTIALDERPTIVLMQPGKAKRAFLLSREQPLSVGRAVGVNSLQVEDPSLSAQHFRIVAKDGEFFVVDLSTTNGTFVNGERIRARSLRSGDVVRAGQAEFEFRVSLVRPS